MAAAGHRVTALLGGLVIHLQLKLGFLEAAATFDTPGNWSACARQTLSQCMPVVLVFPRCQSAAPGDAHAYAGTAATSFASTTLTAAIFGVQDARSGIAPIMDGDTGTAELEPARVVALKRPIHIITANRTPGCCSGARAARGHSGESRDVSWQGAAQARRAL